MGEVTPSTAQFLEMAGVRWVLKAGCLELGSGNMVGYRADVLKVKMFKAMTFFATEVYPKSEQILTISNLRQTVKINQIMYFTDPV